MAEATVRWARQGDIPDMLRLWKLLASYEGNPPDVVSVSEAQVRRDGFGAERRFECLLAEQDGAVVGLAAFTCAYSTWSGQSGMFVHDLILQEEVRGAHLGQHLMAALAAVARKRGWQRIDLNVRPWNPARRFYERLPMRHRDDLLIYSMDAGAIHALAADVGPIAH